VASKINQDLIFQETSDENYVSFAANLRFSVIAFFHPKLGLNQQHSWIQLLVGGFNHLGKI